MRRAREKDGERKTLDAEANAYIESDLVETKSLGELLTRALNPPQNRKSFQWASSIERPFVYDRLCWFACVLFFPA